MSAARRACYTGRVADTWYTLARKRIAPVALILAVTWIAHDTCSRHERRPVTLRFELGPGAARVHELRVDVVSGQDVIGRLRRGREAAGLGAPQLKLSLPDGEVELRIELELSAAPEAPAVATVRKLTRRIHGEGGATVVIPLADELR